MNKLAFFLRNKLAENKFSDIVLAALNLTSVDAAFVCSGFFQEDLSYSVSAKKYASVQRCCNQLDLTVVGYYGNAWKKFSSFVSGLGNHCCPACIKVKAFRIPGDKWHAKVFIAKEGGEPVVAAIGSSNMTRRAFDNFKDFNYECDVIFWDSNNAAVNALVENVLGESADEFPSVAVATVDALHPVNRVPLADRMKALEREIVSMSIPFP